ncbi:MAG: hypothetical protein OEW19_04815 [Acidobacteriota bacterium]|nr:hypothetical protein [Acidobacteriota bacterium]
MIRRCSALVFAAALAVAATVQAQNGVAGDWTLTINGPQGVIDTEASFAQDGDKVTGTLSGPQGDSDISGTMSGSTLSLAFSVVTQNGPLDVTMTADVNGAEMKGTLDFGMGTADFTGKKK